MFAWNSEGTVSVFARSLTNLPSRCHYAHGCLLAKWMFPKIVGFPPKSSILIGFCIINHPFWGTPIFGNTQIMFDSFWLGKKHPVQRNFNGQKGDETTYTSPRCLEMRGFFLQLSLVMFKGHSWQILYRCFTVCLGKSSSNRHLGSFAFILPTILSKPEMFLLRFLHMFYVRE